MEIMNNELLIGICSRYPVSRVSEKREQKMYFTFAKINKGKRNGSKWPSNYGGSSL